MMIRLMPKTIKTYTSNNMAAVHIALLSCVWKMNHQLLGSSTPHAIVFDANFAIDTIKFPHWETFTQGIGCIDSKGFLLLWWYAGVLSLGATIIKWQYWRALHLFLNFQYKYIEECQEYSATPELPIFQFIIVNIAFIYTHTYRELSNKVDCLLPIY